MDGVVWKVRARLGVLGGIRSWYREYKHGEMLEGKREIQWKRRAGIERRDDTLTLVFLSLRLSVSSHPNAAFSSYSHHHCSVQN